MFILRYLVCFYILNDILFFSNKKSSDGLFTASHKWLMGVVGLFNIYFVCFRFPSLINELNILTKPYVCYEIMLHIFILIECFSQW